MSRARLLVYVIDAALALAAATVLAGALAGLFTVGIAPAQARTSRTCPSCHPGSSRPVPTTAPRGTTPRATVPTTTSHPTHAPPPTTARAPATSPYTTAPDYSYPTYSSYSSTLPYGQRVSTTSTSTSSTTLVAPLGPQLPRPQATVPLSTKGTSGHVDPVFAMLSGAGFFLALLIMVGSFLMSRPSRQARLAARSGGG